MTPPWAFILFATLAVLGLSFRAMRRARARWRDRAELCADLAEDAVSVAGECVSILREHMHDDEACSCWVPDEVRP